MVLHQQRVALFVKAQLPTIMVDAVTNHVIISAPQTKQVNIYIWKLIMIRHIRKFVYIVKERISIA